MEVKKIVEGMTAQQVAQVIDDNFKAQNKILEEDIATQNSVIGVSEYKDFSEAEAVNVGNVRKYNGFLYECVEATTGAFDASKWKKSSFKAETEKKLSELASEVEKHDRALYISDEYIEPSHITKDSYIASNHNIVSMSGWNIIYIPVSEGDVYKIVGKVSGAWVAVICLVEDVDVFGSKGSVVVLSESNIKTDVNRYIDIPVGVKYIAISSGDVSAVRVYGKDNISMIEKNGNKIKNIENKLTVEKDVSQVSVSERVDNHYYTTSGVYAEDSYKSFHVEYYAVHEGQRIHLKGKYSGNIAAFILAPNKGEKAYYIYGQGTHGVQSEIDTIITVPSGVNWLARSFSGTSTTLPYLVEEVDYLDYLDSKISKDEDFGLNLKGKRLLAIGDSITAQMYWQTKVGNLLGMNVRTHAKGGIGIIQMVDGDGSGEAPEGYDPDSYGASIYRLNQSDVADVDIIVLMGFYNTRGLAKSNLGTIGDMYPNQNTWLGQMNYAVKRVYEELKKADNHNCKVVICSAHKYGKYPYNNESAYDDGKYLLDATKMIAERHSLPLIDLMNCGNINMYNWDEFQASNTPYASDYIPSDGVNNGENKPFASLNDAPFASDNANKYITVSGFSGCYQSDGTKWNRLDYPVAPWNADQLHLNRIGGERIGEYIASQLLTFCPPK